MANKQEVEEKVTVKTPDDAKETVEETIEEQPAAAEKGEQDTGTERARIDIHRNDKGVLDQNLVDRYNAGEGHPALTEQQQKEALANKKEGAARFDANTAQGVEEGTITPPVDTSGTHIDVPTDTPSAPSNPETPPTSPTIGVSEEAQENAPTANDTEAGSEENAEGVAEEVQAIDPSTIPTDPDDFQAWVQSHPETKKIYDFLINDSDAKLKESQRKERREAAGIALGNLMRAFTNLYYTTQGSPNAYNNEEADKVTEGVHTHYDRWRKQLDDNRKERWEQYQKLRNQYAQERQQAHKEKVDDINIQIAQNNAATKAKLAELDAQVKAHNITEAAAKAQKAQIQAENEQTNQELQQEKTRQQANTEKSKQASNYASANKSNRDAETNEKNAESLASLRKTQEGVNRAREQNLLEGDNDDSPYGGGSSIGW